MKKFQPNFRTVLPVLLILSFLSGSTSLLTAQHKCGFDRQMEIAKMNNPMYEQNRRAIEEFTRNFASSRNQTVTKIPTVVHIVHNGEAVGTYPNISDAQIQSAITNLNAAFKNTTPYAGSAYYNNPMDIEFALVMVSPTGTASTGIERHNVTGKSYAATYNSSGISSESGQPGVPQAELFGDYLWNPQDYMNIWIVKKIDGVDVGATGNGTLGYATLPMTNPGVTDGLVCQARAFGYYPSYDPNSPPADFDFGTISGISGNGTADHEVGHYLNLHHTFNGDNNGAACPSGAVVIGTNDDGCDDIPRHKRTESVCPAYSATGNECGNGTNEYIYNFMNYSSDPCFQGFSNDQKTRCEAAVNGPRAAFKTSIAATAPVGAFPTAIPATVTNAQPDNMGIYTVVLGGTTYSSLGSYHDGGYLNRIASQATTVLNYATNYTLSVAVGVGNTQYGEHVAVYIDYNGNGSFADAGEAVFSSAAGKMNGQAFNISFATPSNVGFAAAGPPANTRLRMRIISDFDNGGGNPISSPTYSPSQGGQIEDYSVSFGSVLPVELVDFNGQEEKGQVILDWQTSSEYNNTGFEVQRSLDNRSFEKVGFVAGAGTTEIAQDYLFIDTNVRGGQYYYYRLKQSDMDGQSQLSHVISVKVADEDRIKLFPNPANAWLTIENLNENSPLEYEIYNSLGMKVISGVSSENSQQIEVRELPKGNYFVRMTTGNGQSVTKKVVLGL